MTLTVKKMLKAGMHLGHKTGKWNPKMAPYIYTKNNNLHIIDLIKAYSYTMNALKFAEIAASQGQTIMFVGTKKEAKKLIADTALECNSFYVNEKWVGGLFTNWETFEKSTERLLLLEKQEKNGFLNKLPKKEQSKKLKEKEKLTKLFDGIKHMRFLPDLVVIVGQLEEMNAVNECNRCGIRTMTLMDTDCNPSVADFIIPSNDDSVATIQLILDAFASSIKKGQYDYDHAKKKPIPQLLVQRNKSSIAWKKQKAMEKLARKKFVEKQALEVPVLQEKPTFKKVVATK